MTSLLLLGLGTVLGLIVGVRTGRWMMFHNFYRGDRYDDYDDSYYDDGP